MLYYNIAIRNNGTFSSTSRKYGIEYGISLTFKQKRLKIRTTQSRTL